MSTAAGELPHRLPWPRPAASKVSQRDCSMLSQAPKAASPLLLRLHCSAFGCFLPATYAVEAGTQQTCILGSGCVFQPSPDVAFYKHALACSADALHHYLLERCHSRPAVLGHVGGWFAFAVGWLVRMSNVSYCVIMPWGQPLARSPSSCSRRIAPGSYRKDRSNSKLFKRSQVQSQKFSNSRLLQTRKDRDTILTGRCKLGSPAGRNLAADKSHLTLKPSSA